MKNLKNKIEIDKIMRSLQSAFNKMSHQEYDKRLILNLDKEKESPYLTIENSIFIFFENLNNEAFINIEIINEDFESTKKIKEFPLSQSFEACQFILSHYFSTRIMSKMEEEYFS